MDPRKNNATRGYRQRESRRQQAKLWQPTKSEENMSSEPVTRTISPLGIFLIILGVLALIALCCYGPALLFLPRQSAAPAAPQLPTIERVTILTTVVAPVPTQTPFIVAPTAPTLAPTLVPTLAPVACDTPSIKAGLNAADTEYGEFLDTTLGKRMTFTNRKVVVPAKAWNDPLTAAELKSVETTWLSMQVCVPKGLTAVIFTGGFEQGVNRYETGALLSLTPGLYEFRMRNGEVVIWYPNQETFSSKDLERIVTQIRNGNFDIKGPLAFFGVTADLFPSIPQDLVKQDNVQIVSTPDPVVK